MVPLLAEFHCRSTGLARRPSLLGRRAKLDGDQTQRAPSALRARQNWLTCSRCASWRRTNRVPLAGIVTRHHREWSTDWGSYRHRRTHWDRCPHGDRCPHRSTYRYWRTHGDRCSHGHWRTHGSADGRGHNGGNRPRQRHRNAGHLRQWSTSRTARARTGGNSGTRRSCGSGLTRLRLEAFVAAGYQRGGRSMRAQRHCDPAQPSPDSNNSDGELIKDRHRRRLLHSRSGVSPSSDAAEPHAVPQSRVRRPRQLSAANLGSAPRRTAPLPNGDVRNGLTPRESEPL
jgi:hypothetical protein